MTRRHHPYGVVIAGRLLLTVLFIAAGPRSGAAQGQEPLVVPRPVEIRLERLAADHADLALRMAVRSTRSATIRRLSFPEATLDGVPIWIEPVDVQWHVDAARDSVLPQLLRVRLYLRDLMQELDLRALAARGSARVRATAEVDVEMPWLARLLLPGSRRTMMLDTEVDVPLYAEGGVVASMARVVATAIDAGRTIIAPRFTGATAADRDVLARHRATAAEVSIRFAIEAPAGRTASSVHGLGFWAAPGVLCTTREVLEPWRFDLRTATALQYQQHRLVVEHASVTADDAGSRQRRIDIRQSGQGLPELTHRKVYVWLDGKPRQIALAQREHHSNVICLRFPGEMRSASASLAGHAPPEGPLAAFVTQGGAIAVRRASARSRTGGLLRLDPPLNRSAHGSPIVSDGGVNGMVLSASAAASMDVVREALGQAVPVFSPSRKPPER